MCEYQSKQIAKLKCSEFISGYRQWLSAVDALSELLPLSLGSDLAKHFKVYSDVSIWISPSKSLLYSHI